MNICTDKYLMIYAWYAHKNACMSSCEVSIICHIFTKLLCVDTLKMHEKVMSIFRAVTLLADVPWSWLTCFFFEFPLPKKDVPNVVMRTDIKGYYARDVLTAQLAFVWHTQTTWPLLWIWRNSSRHWFLTTIDLWKRLRKIMRRSPFASHLRLAAISSCHRPSSRVTVPAFKAFAPHLPQQRSDNLC